MTLYNRKVLLDGSFYPSIPVICGCPDLNCRAIVYGNHEFITGHNSKGKNNPMFEKPTFGHKGKHHSPESCKKISNNHADVSNDRNPMYNSHRYGENNPNWNNGSSFLPYCEKFNTKFKESIRERDSYTCQLCGKTQEENTKGKRRLTVHHIHHDKSNCYPDCITLCCSCNFKVENKNKIKYYEDLFMNNLNDRCLLFGKKN